MTCCNPSRCDTCLEDGVRFTFLFSMNSVYHTNELMLFSQLEHVLNKGHSIFRLPTKQRNASLLTSHSGNEFLSKLTGDTFYSFEKNDLSSSAS